MPNIQLLWITLILSSAMAGDDEQTPSRVHAAEDWQPPGYYQFFHKTGELEQLPAEVRRDEQIAAGGRAPEAITGEVPDLSLPDSEGILHSLVARADKRRLVIITFRTWW